MALDPCPHCGKDFDHNNAGARANHIESCKEEAKKYQQGRQQGPSDPSAQQRQQVSRNPPSQPEDVPPTPGDQEANDAARADAQPPAQPPQQQRKQAGVPATQQNTQAIQQGIEVGQNIGQFMDGSRGEKLQGVAGALAAVGKQIHDQEQQARERAKNADTDTVQAAQQYPVCGECGGQITSMPAAGEEFSCPHCGIRLIA